ncbi:general transcription factor IIH subunit 5-like [Tenrec ecaudatus]|uniref:general transcription factor IIH subunit 5-like n=1 Tax=Tenrec ecaudatus TaxID=94439 RepID=UPI003F594781
MVNILKGVLIECDPAMKQFLLFSDESNALWKKFIIQDIDDTHVFVVSELLSVFRTQVGELMDQNAWSLIQK